MYDVGKVFRILFGSFPLSGSAAVKCQERQKLCDLHVLNVADRDRRLHIGRFV